MTRYDSHVVFSDGLLSHMIFVVVVIVVAENARHPPGWRTPAERGHDIHGRISGYQGPRHQVCNCMCYRIVIYGNYSFF